MHACDCRLIIKDFKFQNTQKHAGGYHSMTGQWGRDLGLRMRIYLIIDAESEAAILCAKTVTDSSRSEGIGPQQHSPTCSAT